MIIIMWHFSWRRHKQMSTHLRHKSSNRSKQWLYQHPNQQTNGFTGVPFRSMDDVSKAAASPKRPLPAWMVTQENCFLEPLWPTPATYRHGEAPPTQHVVTLSITFYRAYVNFSTFNNSLSLWIPLHLERKQNVCIMFIFFLKLVKKILLGFLKNLGRFLKSKQSQCMANWISSVCYS